MSRKKKKYHIKSSATDIKSGNIDFEMSMTIDATSAQEAISSFHASITPAYAAPAINPQAQAVTSGSAVPPIQSISLIPGWLNGLSWKGALSLGILIIFFGIAITSIVLMISGNIRLQDILPPIIKAIKP